MNIIRTFLRISLASLLLVVASAPAHAQGEQSKDTTTRRNATGRVEPMDSFNGAGAGSFKSGASGGGAALRTTTAAPSQTFGGGRLGATVGGAQDIGYARRLIREGQVPGSIDFSPEGLYSEHDIPTPPGDCDDLLCLSLGYGYVPTADNGSNAVLVQLGMESNLKTDEFRRRPLRLALVVDKSGSMAGEKVDAVREALRTLARRLTAEDRVILIAFDDQAYRYTSLLVGSDTARLMEGIGRLSAGRGTSIESGLMLGYSALDSLPTEHGVERRLMLFTDMQPNVGTTDGNGFLGLVQRYADRGIGMTSFGVGIDFGQELATTISKVRGCNYFYLEDGEKIARVFDRDFDYMVTPLLYDLDVHVTTPAGLRLAAVYGLPGWTPGDRDAQLHVPTVFLSRNRGAIVLRYEAEDSASLVLDADAPIAEGTLSFTDIDGEKHRSEAELRNTTGDRLQAGTAYATHDGMKIAAGLTNIYFGLREGCRLHAEGNDSAAVAAIGRARGAVLVENLMLQDAGLSTELDLLDKLRDNIRSGAAQSGLVPRRSGE